MAPFTRDNSDFRSSVLCGLASRKLAPAAMRRLLAGIASQLYEHLAELPGLWQPADLLGGLQQTLGDLSAPGGIGEALETLQAESVLHHGRGHYLFGGASPSRNGGFPMTLKSRLKKLEQAIGKAPCSVCCDWWNGPIVMRNETDPPAHRDPDVCPSCGRKCPSDRILEIVISEEIIPPTFTEQP